MDAVFNFARHFVSTRYEDIPDEAVMAAKREVLDSLATALGGSVKEGVGELVDLAREWGGTPQSTIIAHGLKCPAPQAAQVNSTMIHALDYDDGHQEALVHTGCITVATCFAVAERQGVVSGREFLTAMALGMDFLSRLGLASQPGKSALSSGWHPTTLFGFLGSAAMAGRLIKLDDEKMVNAIGLAYHQCGGAGSGVADGALAKRMGPGFASRAGITAALMAERGITGEKNSLEGKSSLFRVYFKGDYDPTSLTAGLGKTYEGINVTQKPYPCCGLTHACIDATLSLRSRYKIRPEKVSSIIVRGGQAVFDLSQPPERKCTPRTVIDAQFSVPWVVATALINGRVTVADFTEKAITRKNIQQVARLVTARLEPSLNRHGVGPAGVTIIMEDGTEYHELVEHCLGSIQRPMTFDDCARKFRECALSAARPLPAATIEEVIAMVADLENLADATEIVRRLG